jgi:hypothetical protein
LPKEISESTKELIVWKRFRDFRELYQILQIYHSSLHRRDAFPDFIKPSFFGRFDEKVIEERRQYSLRLLQFIGSQGHLYKNDLFINFLSDGTFYDYKAQDDNILKPIIIFNHNTSNKLNDSWTFDDFNLNSNDFNQDLKSINGKINELNSNYKIYKYLNANCLLMKSTLGEDSKLFLLKVIIS